MGVAPWPIVQKEWTSRRVAGTVEVVNGGCGIDLTKGRGRPMVSEVYEKKRDA
jgi:hypothetical protein